MLSNIQRCHLMKRFCRRHSSDPEVSKGELQSRYVLSVLEAKVQSEVRFTFLKKQPYIKWEGMFSYHYVHSNAFINPIK